MFLAAAQTLADQVTSERLSQGALYPKVAELRRVSRAIAIRVIREARDSGIGRAYHDDQIEPTVDAAMWYPAYTTYQPKKKRL
jgi:malic enzyme